MCCMRLAAHTFPELLITLAKKDYYYENTFCLLQPIQEWKNLHTTPNSQRLIDNLAIDNPLMYAALALDCELQAWADAMDEDWNV